MYNEHRNDKELKKSLSNDSGDKRVLVQGDFMAFEVRWLALVAQDPVLGDLFKRGYELRQKYRKNPTKKLKLRAELEGDIHRNTASEAYGIPVMDVSKVQRTGAKAIVFGQAYGKSIKNLARDLHVDEKEAQALYEKIFGKLKKTQEWFDFIESHAQNYGWVESPFGRRRHIIEFLLGDIGRGKRLARNSVIQSAASDTCLCGLGLMQAYIEKHGLEDEWKLVNAVHDSFLLEVPLRDLRKVLRVAERIFTVKVSKYITKHFDINLDICPLEVEFEIGVEWGNLVKWDFAEGQLDLIIDWLKAGHKALSKQDKLAIEKIENWLD